MADNNRRYGAPGPEVRKSQIEGAAAAHMKSVSMPLDRRVGKYKSQIDGAALAFMGGVPAGANKPPKGPDDSEDNLFIYAMQKEDEWDDIEAYLSALRGGADADDAPPEKRKQCANGEGAWHWQWVMRKERVAALQVRKYSDTALTCKQTSEMRRVLERGGGVDIIFMRPMSKTAAKMSITASKPKAMRSDRSWRNARVLWAIWDGVNYKTGRGVISLEVIAAKAGVARSTAAEGIKDLVRLGWVFKHNRRHRASEFLVTNRVRNAMCSVWRKEVMANYFRHKTLVSDAAFGVDLTQSRSHTVSSDILYSVIARQGDCLDRILPICAPYVAAKKVPFWFASWLVKNNLDYIPDKRWENWAAVAFRCGDGDKPIRSWRYFKQCVLGYADSEMARGDWLAHGSNDDAAPRVADYEAGAA